MDQVAKKLEVPLHALTHCQVRHPELWKRACDEAAVHAADIVRGMAGTSRVFVNSGKLTRLASRPADTVESSDAPGRVQGSGLLTFLEEVYLPDRLRITKEVRTVSGPSSGFMRRSPVARSLLEI